jgi:hypothetical protein
MRMTPHQACETSTLQNGKTGCGLIGRWEEGYRPGSFSPIEEILSTDMPGEVEAKVEVVIVGVVCLGSCSCSDERRPLRHQLQ